MLVNFDYRSYEWTDVLNELFSFLVASSRLDTNINWQII